MTAPNWRTSTVIEFTKAYAFAIIFSVILSFIAVIVAVMS